MRPDPRDVIKRYEEAKSLRSPLESDWRMAAAYCLPRDLKDWMTEGATNPGGNETARRYAFDGTGVNALPKYISVLMRLCTPTNLRWHKLMPMASDTALSNKRRVKLYFDQLTDILFSQRYDPNAMFIQSVSEAYAAIGVYGTGPMFVGRANAGPFRPAGGVAYKAVKFRDIFLLTDDEGRVTTVFRRFFLTARQFRNKWPELIGKEPKSVALELKKPNPSETNRFEIIHVVQPRNDRNPKAFDASAMAFTGDYLSVKDAEYIGENHGYRSFPYLTPRTFTTSEDPYGYSPAVQALASLGSVNAMKKVVLKAGQKAVDPVLLAHDDGIMGGSYDARPGSVLAGGVDSQGRALIQTLPSGNIQVGEHLIEDERGNIKESFFVTLFQTFTDTPTMTATEVIERSAEKAAEIAPTMGRLQTELLAPLITREMDVLHELGRLRGLEMPPELIEARGEYEIIYTSPLSKGQYAEEISGFARTLEVAVGASQATGDPSLLDFLDLDAALPELADKLAVPARWLRDENSIKARRDQRSQQHQQQMLADNAPAIASVAKTMATMPGRGAA